MASFKHNVSDDNEESNLYILKGPPPAYEGAKDGTEPARGPRSSPARDSGLIRGLQVPSCFSYITSGFRYPQTLKEAGIEKAKWLAFTDDIERHAYLSSSQWAETVGSVLGVCVVGIVAISWFAIIPASIVGYQMRKHREHRNMRKAFHCGSLELCLKRWNESYFKPRGLFVTVVLPGCPDYDLMKMDLSVPKVLGGRMRKGKISAAPVNAKDATNWMQTGDYIKASKKRNKAIKKCRIVIMPLG